ncbi:MATE family efflux transporter [Oceanicella sp. SM1341]|uniref:MATE family efflux transporter n=1 Tax=Oceanicella sp. SM1341 TaxID=1548889 RepID=UPI0018E4E34D|nr:MATE family efflux transporter [Oceanicella sp. SM1341]
MSGTGPGARTGVSLFRLALPLVLQSCLSMVVMLVDTMIISAHSPAAAAAVNVATQVLMVAYEVSALLGVGGVVLISHALGRGDVAAARAVAAVTVLANALLGLAVGALLALAAPLLLRLLDTPAALTGEAHRFILIVAAAMGFNGFMMAAIPCLRGFGRNRTILGLCLVAYTLYLGAEYVLILGWGPVPALGVTGSALGTLGMRVVCAVALGAVMVRGLGVNLSPRAAPWGRVGRLFALSLPSVSDNIAYVFYQLITLGFITGFGLAGVLARAYTMVATSFLTLVIMAVSQANEVRLGWHGGGGRPEAVQGMALRAAGAAMLLATALAAALHAGSGLFLGLFTDDPEVLALGRELLLLTVALQPGFALNTVLYHALKGVGDVRWPAAASLAVTWGMGLPLAWLLAVHLGQGVRGIWLAMIAEEVVKAALMLARWQGRRWRGLAPA